uniref:Amine oxidase n=1 Tax=Salarias fasciatus TaxID=181472 RepID=A0A672I101_SALFA
MTAEIWDVVIVGAGLSGLSAADLLRKRDGSLKILILEAKDRVGGRTVSKEFPAASGVDRWDLGGQWVGSTQTHVMELIKELGLEVYPQFSTGKKVHHMGGPASKVRTYKSNFPTLSPLVLMDFIQFLWKIDRLCATVCVRDPSQTPNAAELDGQTLHSYIQQHVWTAEEHQWNLRSSPTVISVSSPQGGTQQLSERLADRVGWKNVRLGSAVTAIWQDAEWARVTTATDTFLCRAVIVTCPPHLAAKIQYEPALPTEREFLTQNMPVGHMIKFIVTYQTAFWKEKGFSGEIAAGASTDCPFAVTFDATSPRGNAALVGFISGQQASLWASKERRSAVLSSLVKYLGPEAASFIHYEEKDWAKETYNGGCPVNVMAPGLLTYYHPSLRMPCGRIHWAGTETATQWCGYMSGAIQAGQRAALEVLAEVSQVVLNEEEREVLQQSLPVQSPAKPTTSWKLTGKPALVLPAAQRL